MKTKDFSRRRGTKKVGFCSLLIAAGLVEIVAVGNSSVASAASLTDGLIISPVYQQYEADKNANMADKWVLVPNKYYVEVTEGGKGGGENLPAQYNLVEAGYGTTIKNQGGDGICWAYATTTAMESYLKKTQGINAEFSPKQLDYVMTSSTSYGKYFIDKFETSRDLGSGGNFAIASVGLRSDYVVDSETAFFKRMQTNDNDLDGYVSFKQYNDLNLAYALLEPYNKEMTEAQILGDKAEYLVDGFERIAMDDPDAIAKIKKNVYTNGAVYVGTYAPELENCWDDATNTIIDRGNDACGPENGHAMSIVGWDDNHTYTDPGTGTTKAGAFILQNSYGKNTLFEDYDISVEDIIYAYTESGAYEGKTEAEIDEFNEQIDRWVNNWDAHEFLYLAYDFESSAQQGAIDFAAITSMVKNDFEEVYDMTKSTVEKDGTDLVFKISSDEDQALTMVGLDTIIPMGEETTVKLEIDADNDGVAESSKTIKNEALEFGRKTVELDDPVLASGEFSVRMSLAGYELETGDARYLSPLVYGEDPDNYEWDIEVPNTGFSMSELNGQLVSVSLVGVVLGGLAIALIPKLNRKKVGFEKK